ncbi:MAG: DUF456 domain-containing protein [Desulfuromonadales bacterium]|nr:DUF456 domain-containing protein [Desulfuromonadales bacterium]
MIIIGIILLICGFIGSVALFIPGPPLAYCSLILLQLTHFRPFSTIFLIVWAIVVFIVVLLDYYIPIWGTKRFGGTRGGTIGAMIGLVVGLLLSPAGILIGPFIGAFIGELIAGQTERIALRSAIGAFIGFLAGTFVRLVVCGMMAFYFVKAII